MTCRDCAEFLSDYVAGELDAEVAGTFERHLTLCPNCLTYLEQFRVTIRAGQLAFADDAEAELEVPEDLIRAIVAARRK